MPPRPLPIASLPGLALLAMGAAGSAAIWVLASFALNIWSSLFAFIATLDIVWLARMARLRPGPWRAAQAMLATALAIALAQWWLLASDVGAQLGLLPWESIPKMGGGFVWTLAKLRLEPFDLAIQAAAVTLAGWWSR
ncbi:hypothetical protein EBB59_10265 [Lysobacter pythonis]|uniref:Uncharacterized protein n=1 Tax=Solilutibacter pythonis TaxID=2483112 RepID=A0A3M2HIB6_9GAMM|nr:hypothetical protein [Lysobacter pythonis]RMH89471.1 hypothetical protein EBB59_10265 [Lysobacter pythonis]